MSTSSGLAFDGSLGDAVSNQDGDACGSVALQGTIAPEGGCPGNFFTSRKWTYEQGVLIIRDFKNQPLAQLSYAADHFEGQNGGGKLTLSR